ncbi:epoxide hydrolase family protein [Rhodococcoides yunnanense]|uniref:epoxide hydrolase family protein n=1 Tax=Rhodococcoides yunnanense TaxID=278209 RepID=UPI001C3FB1C9|nr:epoxide hydrolase family protein [Rhodococcus yunnanensis]
MSVDTTGTGAVVKPFRIDIPQSEVDDLQRRLEQTRWSEPLDVADGVGGIARATLERLFARWRDDYDWNREQESLNRFAQIRVDVDGQPVHAVHVRSDRLDAVPLVLLHGWPSTFAEYRDVIEPLTSPARENDPAFHVIVPSLPGYGFSTPSPGVGWNYRRMATAVVGLVEALGYDCYLVHGSDAGQAVAESIAREFPERVIGLHINVGGVRFASQHATETPADDKQRAAIERLQSYLKDKSGYAFLQSTRPETLSYGLTDSPIGQLAWIAEKFIEWGDPGFPVDDDHILTTVSLYWFTRTAASAARFYRESYALGAVEPAVEVPTAVAAFPNDIVPAVREWAESSFDIVQWTDMEAGAHFAALERPDLLIGSIQKFAASLA